MNTLKSIIASIFGSPAHAETLENDDQLGKPSQDPSDPKKREMNREDVLHGKDFDLRINQHSEDNPWSRYINKAQLCYEDMICLGVNGVGGWSPENGGITWRTQGDLRPKFPPVMGGVRCGFDARSGR